MEGGTGALTLWRRSKAGQRVLADGSRTDSESHAECDGDHAGTQQVHQATLSETENMGSSKVLWTVQDSSFLKE